MKPLKPIAIAWVLLVSFGQACAQTPSAGTPIASTLSAAQLDQLTAPIALYSDPLLGMVLVASTYPLEVVEAARWLEDPAHVSLKGDQLATALEQQNWDASIKSLVSFPPVLRMMNTNLEWTEEIGDAFLAQQADVMDSVQRLRQRAVASGQLQSTSQQTVASEQSTITIEPVSSNVLYVPCYAPAVVYGPWPWPGYPPYYFAPDGGCAGALPGFIVGISIFEPYWGWYMWDWPGHGLYIPPRRPRPGVRPREPERATERWQHDPAHRGGVPYRDAATAARYLGSDAASGRPFRGFPTEAPAPAQTGPSGPHPQPTSRPQVTPETRISVPTGAGDASHPVPPAFESFGRGQQVRGEAARGSSSRSMSGGGFGGGAHGGGTSGAHR